MGDTLITVVAIFLAAILMFGIPLMDQTSQNDNIAQLEVQTAANELLAKISTTGEISQDELDAFSQRIAATGNTYDIEIEIQVLDQNPSKKVTQVDSTKIGENIYYTLYTTQIVKEIKNDAKLRKALKEGDIVTIKVKNTNITIAQKIKELLLKYDPTKNATVDFSGSTIVMTNASK